MRRHQTIGKQPRSRPLNGLFQRLFHRCKVGCLAEKPHPSHATIEHVVYQTARSCTNSPWHANNIPETSSLSTETTSDPFVRPPTAKGVHLPFLSHLNPRLNRMRQRANQSLSSS
jgi:hypothetical protein